MITQTNHQFLFGTTGYSIIQAEGSLNGEGKEQANSKVAKLVNLFNYVTLPFYWGRYEPVRGESKPDILMEAARWCVNRNIVVKGHPLCWHTVTADWLLQMSNSEILQTQIRRIQREVTTFHGLIDSWDVINEAVIMPVFDKYDNGITRICKELGRIQMIRIMFEAAREANPNAILLINDFDVSPAYDILIEGCLEAGIEIDVIGIQSHMHQGYWGVEKTKQVLEQFSRFNLPIHFTETNLVSGRLMPAEIVDLNDYQVDDWPSTPEGEDRQAQEAVTHFKTLMAHPLVKGITWWDFFDGGWLNAPAGLLRKDGSSKPAYDELLRLVKGEWWLTPTHFCTDEKGELQFSGFLGNYELSYDGNKYPFSLDVMGENSVVIHIGYN
ncbi:MAG: endo-1,4-beta-xylanase [Anaerolineales bacterium]|nr:endo-1,4-beta-xylanase [Anaerolineales bacterium]